MPYLSLSRLPSAPPRLWKLLWLLKPGEPRVPRIDPNDLPDYLMRDLGLVGGRTSPPRDPLRD